jgi:hypothetical protein
MMAGMTSVPTTQGGTVAIVSIADLIEKLESLRDSIPIKTMTLREYKEVGWVMRPLAGLIDQCREEATSFRWTEQRVREFHRLVAIRKASEAPASETVIERARRVGPALGARACDAPQPERA